MAWEWPLIMLEQIPASVVRRLIPLAWTHNMAEDLLQTEERGLWLLEWGDLLESRAWLVSPVQKVRK